MVLRVHLQGVQSNLVGADHMERPAQTLGMCVHFVVCCDCCRDCCCGDRCFSGGCLKQHCNAVTPISLSFYYLLLYCGLRCPSQMLYRIAMIAPYCTCTWFALQQNQDAYGKYVAIFYLLASVILGHLAVTVWVAIMLRKDDSRTVWLKRCSGL